MADRSHRLPPLLGNILSGGILLGGILLGGAAPADGPQPPPAGLSPAGLAPPAASVPAAGPDAAAGRPTVPATVTSQPAGQAAASGRPEAHGAGEPVGDAIPPQLAGDRADAIAHDMLLHPPQKLVPPQSAFRLLTAKHPLGGLLDRSVRGVENSQVGRVIDVLIGDDGKPVALELDVGGFMGVGNRRIAVAWGLFDLSKPEGSDPLRLALTEAQVKSAPAVEESGQVTVVMGANAAATPKPAASAAGNGTSGASNPADGSGITGPLPGLMPLPAGKGAPVASNPADGSTITPPVRPAAAAPALVPQPATPAVPQPNGSAVPRPAPAAAPPAPRQRS